MKSFKYHFLILALVLVFGLTVVACNNDDDDEDDDDDDIVDDDDSSDDDTTDDDDSTDDDDDDDTVTLSLTFDGLEMLGDGFVYEGWLVYGSTAVSSGRFNIDEYGAAVPSSFEIDKDTADMAMAFVLTIEPDPDDSADPAATHVLAGDISSGAAALTIDHTAALGTDFASAAGPYILETPSSLTTHDPTQGIWWLDPAGSPDPTLVLPVLPAGWAYEGWIVDGSGPISTGRFTAADAVDSDGVGPDAGTDGCTVGGTCPPFPGQDFIDPALILLGLTAVISVEPEPDDSAAPFAIKPLIDADITEVIAPATQDMANQSANNPTGSITLM